MKKKPLADAIKWLKDDMAMGWIRDEDSVGILSVILDNHLKLMDSLHRKVETHWTSCECGECKLFNECREIELP